MKDFHITLKIQDTDALKKLTTDKNTLPSWVLGEEIVKKLKQGMNANIQINLSELFLKYNV